MLAQVTGAVLALAAFLAIASSQVRCSLQALCLSASLGMVMERRKPKTMSDRY